MIAAKIPFLTDDKNNVIHNHQLNYNRCASDNSNVDVANRIKEFQNTITEAPAFSLVKLNIVSKLLQRTSNDKTEDNNTDNSCKQCDFKGYKQTA